MSIDEIINLLIEVRVDLDLIKKAVASEEIKEQFKWAINGIDTVGCELSQNIAKKLKKNKKIEFLEAWLISDEIFKLNLNLIREFTKL